MIQHSEPRVVTSRNGSAWGSGEIGGGPFGQPLLLFRMSVDEGLERRCRGACTVTVAGRSAVPSGHGPTGFGQARLAARSLSSRSPCSLMVVAFMRVVYPISTDQGRFGRDPVRRVRSRGGGSRGGRLVGCRRHRAGRGGRGRPDCGRRIGVDGRHRGSDRSHARRRATAGDRCARSGGLPATDHGSARPVPIVALVGRGTMAGGESRGGGHGRGGSRAGGPSMPAWSFATMDTGWTRVDAPGCGRWRD